jgi:hypothetical protein
MLENSNILQSQVQGMNTTAAIRGLRDVICRQRQALLTEEGYPFQIFKRWLV